MMTQIKNIIFDFDGTLVNTAPLIVKTMQAAIREMDLPYKTDTECRATIGLRLEEVPAVLWPELTDIGAEYAHTYRRIFDELKRPLNVACFPGVVETLESLSTSGYRIAIASSRSHQSLEEYVELFNLNECFDMLVGGNDVTHGKPSPEPVQKILDAKGWNADETLVVGDAPVDIQMGQASGTRTCAVTYGNGTVAALTTSHPDHIVSSFTELTSVLS